MRTETISLINHQRTIMIRTREFAAILSRTIDISPLNKRLHCGDDLAVNLIGKRRMSQINRKFVGHAGTTDVISFSYLDNARDFSGIVMERTVGELFICPAVAEDRVNRGEGFGTIGEEVVLYGVHGILHLSGFDDRTPSDAQQMRAAEARIIRSLRRDYDLSIIATRKDLDP